MKPKPTNIDFAHALSGFYFKLDLGLYQIHVLTFVVARLARKLPCDTASIMDAFTGQARKTVSTTLTMLESKGYLTSERCTLGGRSGQFRTMKATQKTKDFVNNLKATAQSALAMVNPPNLSES